MKSKTAERKKKTMFIFGRVGRWGRSAGDWIGKCSDFCKGQAMERVDIYILVNASPLIVLSI